MNKRPLAKLAPVLVKMVHGAFVHLGSAYVQTFTIDFIQQIADALEKVCN